MEYIEANFEGKCSLKKEIDADSKMKERFEMFKQCNLDFKVDVLTFGSMSKLFCGWGQGLAAMRLYSIIDSILVRRALATGELLDTYNKQLVGKIEQANNWVLDGEIAFEKEVSSA
jgi:hypothetical protein